MNKKLSASTLAEILVVILVTGVVLTAVIEGLGLFGRHTAGLSARIVESGQIREGYFLLDHLITTADSITHVEGRITSWRGGEPRGVLYLRDSMLLNSSAARPDTLLRGVIALNAIPEGIDAPPDSVSLVLLDDNRMIRLSIPIITPGSIVRQREILRTEEEYVFSD
jgi:hypothetical protein